MRVLETGIFLIMITVGISGFSQDNTPPDRPYITFVTVDTATNDVIVNWTSSSSPDNKQYNIYFEILTINGYEGVKLDSIPAGNLTYTHTGSNAGLKSILYSVTALDSSGNESVRKPGLHSTVYSDIFYDSCNHSMRVFWNKYIGWNTNVSGYRIYEKEGNGNFSLLNGIDANDSSYTVNNIRENTHYYYFIEAVKNDGLVSRSNIAHKYSFAPAPPELMTIDYVTVQDDNTVELNFEFSDTSSVNDFVLLRSSDINSDFIIQKYLYNLTSSPVNITDNFLTNQQVFFYKIGAINSCLSIIDTSNIAVNILVTGNYNNNTNILNWNNYQNFPNGISEYQIFRIDNAGTYTLLETLPSSAVSYNDNLTDFFGEPYSGKIRYKVNAIENTTGNISSSNICEIKVESKVTMPTAFTPNSDGKNDIFKPIFNFIPEDFLMLIYDRNGLVIYKTKDPEEGWNGQINGNKPAPEGVYSYHIQFTSFNEQKKVVKPGTVTLFYP